MDVTRGVATFNLVAQVLLLAVLLSASALAWRGKLRVHCLLMRGVMVAQLLLIGVIMAPQVGRYYADWPGLTGFTVELVIHHVLGALALLLSVYVNLAFAGLLKRPKRFAMVMRVTLLMWVASLGLGVHVFWYLWL